MKVLLSIKPEYAEKILTGEKTIEYRRRIFRKSVINTIVMYATLPIGKVIGEFTIENVLWLDINVLWEQTSHIAGITEQCFRCYFEGVKNGYGIQIDKVYKYDERIDIKSMGIKIPQSFCYIPNAWRR